MSESYAFHIGDLVHWYSFGAHEFVAEITDDRPRYGDLLCRILENPYSWDGNGRHVGREYALNMRHMRLHERPTKYYDTIMQATGG